MVYPVDIGNDCSRRKADCSSATSKLVKTMLTLFAYHRFRCHLTQTYEWAVWFAPMLATVFLNLIFYILILRDFRQQEKIHGRIDMKKQLSLYLLAFVLCWIFDIAEHIVTLAKPNCELYWLWLLQDFFSPLQGKPW
jgi:hypothetical protein